MRAPVFLQARMSSTRLPGKVLLPVAGYPLIVLAARRAANRGHDVTVLTSDDASDDTLVDTLDQYGIAIRRGSLNDVLSRFADAVADLGPDQPIVRLTGDNPVPDGTLLEELEERFVTENLSYVSSLGPRSGLPYGLSAEIVRAGDLVAAAKDPATTDFQREHVTPAVIDRHGRLVYSTGLPEEYEALRLTVDTLEDYLRISRLFDTLPDPLSPGYRELAALAARMESGARPNARPTFVLGGVQLGLDYGIANGDGKPAPAVARWIVEQALANGAGWIDTAQAYGDSEAVIGSVIGSLAADVEVVTKIRPVQGCAERTSTLDQVDRSVTESCQRLGRAPTVLFHRYADSRLWNESILELLASRQREGAIKAVGVSVQSPAELLKTLDESRFTSIQMPFNLLDWRWDEAIGKLEQARGERSIVIHVRSVFLQGLLLSGDPGLWARANCPDHSGGSWLDRLVDRLERRDRCDLCLAYIKAHGFVDGVVVGCETPAQLAMNLAAFQRPPLSPEQVATVRTLRPMLGMDVLNPALWG